MLCYVAPSSFTSSNFGGTVAQLVPISKGRNPMERNEAKKGLIGVTLNHSGMRLILDQNLLQSNF